MSVLDLTHRHVFIHVPKTAGSSMERCGFVGGVAHATAASIREFMRNHVVGARWGDLFKWGFVREPLDRFVSAFFHEPNVTGTLRAREAFEWFVREFRKAGINIVAMKAGAYRFHHHFIPQHYFLCDPRGRILVDFVGRFSRLTEDFSRVCERIGVSATLPRERATQHAPYQEYYNARTEAMVRELYARDYEIFREF